MDFVTLLYDPIDEIFGVPAMPTPNRQGAAGVTLAVIERTASADASEKFETDTLRPGAFVRRREITNAGMRPPNSTPALSRSVAGAGGSRRIARGQARTVSPPARS